MNFIDSLFKACDKESVYIAVFIQHFNDIFDFTFIT